MPPPHSCFPLNPYRPFHLYARLRLYDTPAQLSTRSDDDYYALLLNNPLPHSASVQKLTSSAPTSAPASNTEPLPASTASPIQTSTKGPDNKVSFGRVLSGPSPRMRGLERAVKGMGRPTEPDNCCMSGCVNCVWDAYREEVEEWAAARRKGAAELGGLEDGSEDEGGGVGDLDEGFRDVEVGGENLFEGLPVGIREFMNTEKRLRERRGKGG